MFLWIFGKACKSHIWSNTNVIVIRVRADRSSSSREHQGATTWHWTTVTKTIQAYLIHITLQCPLGIQGCAVLKVEETLVTPEVNQWIRKDSCWAQHVYLFITQLPGCVLFQPRTAGRSTVLKSIFIKNILCSKNIPQGHICIDFYIQLLILPLNIFEYVLRPSLGSGCVQHKVKFRK